MFFQTSNRAFQINCVPKNDGSHQQVEAAGPITLALEAAIAHFAQTVEEHSLGLDCPMISFHQGDSEAVRQSIHAREDGYRDAQDSADLRQQEVLLFLTWQELFANRSGSNRLKIL